MSKDLCITPLQHEMRAARAVEPFVVAILPRDKTTGVFAFLKYKVTMILYANITCEGASCLERMPRG
jgi:hypothetical protein